MVCLALLGRGKSRVVEIHRAAALFRPQGDTDDRCSNLHYFLIFSGSLKKSLLDASLTQVSNLCGCRLTQGARNSTAVKLPPQKTELKNDASGHNISVVLFACLP